MVRVTSWQRGVTLVAASEFLAQPPWEGALHHLLSATTANVHFSRPTLANSQSLNTTSSLWLNVDVIRNILTSPYLCAQPY